MVVIGLYMSHITLYIHTHVYILLKSALRQGDYFGPQNFNSFVGFFPNPPLCFIEAYYYNFVLYFFSKSSYSLYLSSFFYIFFVRVHTTTLFFVLLLWFGGILFLLFAPDCIHCFSISPSNNYMQTNTKKQK